MATRTRSARCLARRGRSTSPSNAMVSSVRSVCRTHSSKSATPCPAATSTASSPCALTRRATTPTCPTSRRRPASPATSPDWTGRASCRALDFIPAGWTSTTSTPGSDKGRQSLRRSVPPVWPWNISLTLVNWVLRINV
jgi:hypothetical protein